MKTGIIRLAAALGMIGSPISVAAQDSLTFRIGILGGQDVAARTAAHECLRERATNVLGHSADIVPVQDYLSLIDALVAGDVDLAWIGSAGYARAYLADPDAVQPILTRVNSNGTFGKVAIGIARADSGVTDLAGMQSRSIGFDDRNSFDGYMVAAAELSAITGADLDGGYFSSVSFSGSGENLISAVIDGDVDGAVLWTDGLGAWEEGYQSGALHQAVASGQLNTATLVEFWRSSPIPNGPIVINKGLSEEIKVQVTALLATLPSLDPDCAEGVMAGKALGYMPISHNAYLHVIEARRAQIADAAAAAEVVAAEAETTEATE